MLDTILTLWYYNGVKGDKLMELKTFKVGIKENADVEFNGRTYALNKDYWTSVKLEENSTDSAIKIAAKQNLMVNIAKYFLGNIRLWKRLYIDNSDLVIIK